MAERLYLRLAEDETHGPEAGLPPHSVHRLPVPAPLHGHVAHILRYQEHIADGDEVVEHVLPDGATRLIVQGLDGQPSAQLIGASLRSTTVRMRGRIDGWSITLRPGATVTLFGVTAAELAGRVVPLDLLWSRAGEFIERFAAARDDRGRAETIGSVLGATRVATGAAAATASRQALELIASAPEDRPVAALAQAVGLGERRLQQLFQAEVGLSPRGVTRLARLHRLLRALRGRPRPGWAELALQCGYFDQAHLVNEFRDLAGMTPGDYVARAVSGSSKTAT